jgi:hypothetical protein
MEKGSYDNRIEQDIARCNQDISKTAGQPNISPQLQKSNLSAKASAKTESASRVMPAFEDILKNKDTQSHPPIQSAGEKEFVRKMVEKISHPQQQDRSNEIPSLDLGKQILAQQRKIAALKRKSPGQEIKPQPVQIKLMPQKNMAGSMPQAPASPQQRIIADIVAKEIMILTSVR